MSHERVGKIAAGAIIGGLLIAVIASFAFSSDPSTDSSTDKPAATPAESDPDIRLLASKSFCIADPSSAKIHFYMILRNLGGTGDIDATPWRRYSDNSVNDSFVDKLTMTVPANSTEKFKAEFGYNAESHSLLECGLKVEDDSESTKFLVVR